MHLERARHLWRHVHVQLGAAIAEPGEICAQRLSAVTACYVHIDHVARLLTRQYLEVHHLTDLVGGTVQAEEHLGRTLVGREGDHTAGGAPRLVACHDLDLHLAHAGRRHKAEQGQAIRIGDQFERFTSYADLERGARGRTIGPRGQQVDRVVDARPQSPPLGHDIDRQRLDGGGDHLPGPSDVLALVRRRCLQYQIGLLGDQRDLWHRQGKKEVTVRVRASVHGGEGSLPPGIAQGRAHRDVGLRQGLPVQEPDKHLSAHSFFWQDVAPIRGHLHPETRALVAPDGHRPGRHGVPERGDQAVGTIRRVRGQRTVGSGDAIVGSAHGPFQKLVAIRSLHDQAHGAASGRQALCRVQRQHAEVDRLPWLVERFVRGEIGAVAAAHGDLPDHLIAALSGFGGDDQAGEHVVLCIVGHAKADVGSAVRVGAPTIEHHLAPTLWAQPDVDLGTGDRLCRSGFANDHSQGSVRPRCQHVWRDDDRLLRAGGQRLRAK